MKKIVLIFVLILALLSGCKKDEQKPDVNPDLPKETDSENVQITDNEGLRKLLNAPKPDKLPEVKGNYVSSEALELIFDLSEYGKGEVYISVDYSGDILKLPEYADSMQAENKVHIVKLPCKEYRLNLYEEGTHRVRTCVVENGEVASLEFSGRYELNGANFKDFTVSIPSGSYTGSLVLEFSGLDGGTVYYTLDGIDPLTVDTAGASLDKKGTELKGSSLALEAGKSKLCARCIKNGIISKLIEAEYELKKSFDSVSVNVAEDESYDYIGTMAAGLRRCNKETGRFEKLGEQEIKSLAVFCESIEESPPVPSGNAEKRSYLYIHVGETVYRSALPGALSWEVYETGVDDMYQQGGWYISSKKTSGTDWNYYSNEKHAYFKYDRVWKGEGSAPEYVSADLSLEKAVFYTEIDNKSNYRVIIKYENGKEMQICSEKEFGYADIELDAVTDDLIMYHVFTDDGAVHKVYDMRSGELRRNRYLQTGDELLGYTDSAIYTLDGRRIAVNYDLM